MTRALFIAALALPLAGCFQSFEAGPPGPAPRDGGSRPGGDAGVPGGDAGAPPVDAGGPTCGPQETLYRELRCPDRVFVGQTATVELSTAPVECCQSGDSTVTLRQPSPFTFLAEVGWSACGCDPLLRCLGPIHEDAIELPTLLPGSYDVQAGDQRCRILVEAAECRPSPVADVWWERTVPTGERALVTVRSPSLGGCGCNPVLSGGGAADAPLSFELCGCCDLCLCIDPDYEGTRRLPVPPSGRIEIANRDALPVTEVPEDACDAEGATVREIVSVSPRSGLRDGPYVSWFEVTGTVATCCPERADVLFAPRPVDEPRTESFEARFCDLCPVDCADPAEVDFVAHLPLEDLELGEHTLIVDEVEIRFTR